MEWSASILTQYSITDLWSMGYIEFFRVVNRAEQVQKKRMQALKKAK